MQFGSRTQHASANKILAKRAHKLMDGGATRDPAAVGALGAARLAAGAAFAAPQYLPSPTSQALITVRKARLGVLALQPAADVPGPVTVPAAKNPRVFRVDAAGSAASPAEVQPHRPTRESQPAVALTSISTLRRCVTAKKRPRPVLHVVHASPLRPEPNPAEPPLDTLIATLASVTPILESIQRAQGFWFVSDFTAAKWEEVWARADELRRGLSMCAKNGRAWSLSISGDSLPSHPF